MTRLSSAVLILLLATLCLANDVHFVPPDPPDSTDLLWTRSDLWTPSPPTETSNVYIDGSQLESSILVNNDDVIINTLYLTNVVLSLDCSAITVNGFTSFIDSSIESTCDIRSELTSLTYEFIGVTMLSGINLIVLEFGKFVEPQLTLVNSKVIVKEDATLIVDQSDTSSPLIAWGNGEDGKTGTGHQGTHGLMLVNTQQQFISVSASEVHNLGVTRDGFLYSWGQNSKGQLGLGDTTNRLVPTKVGLSNVVQASAGFEYSLVRLGNGDVYSFGGAGWSGRLGHGSWSIDEYFPRRIESLSNVVDISAGYSHSLAVMSNGEAKAWGSGTHGRLGTGSSSSSSPQTVLINFSVKKVRAGYDHSMFLTESGELFASGYNYNGQLCVGDTTNRNVPTPIVNSKDFHVIQVSIGKTLSTRTTIFLTTQGEVFSCGRAIGRTTDTVPAHSPGKIEDMGVVSRISCGDYDVFALATGGTLYSWSRWSNRFPSPVPETSELKVGKVYSGSYHWFVHETVDTDISGDDDSSIEIAGKLENRLEFPLLFNTSLIIHSTGDLSSIQSVKFAKRLRNSGTITIDGLLEFDSSSVISLLGGSIKAKDIIFQEFASITGYGLIYSTVFNYATIIPCGVLEIQKDLVVAPNSRVLLNYNNNEVQLVIKGVLSVNGTIALNATRHPSSVHFSVSLVLFGSLISEYASFPVYCDHYFGVVVTTQDYPGPVNVSGQCPSPADNPFYLVVPLNNSNGILWSRNDIWVPSPPNENSTVIIDGNYINQVVFIDQTVIINSLYLTNVVISLDCSSVTVNGFTSFIDSSIESTCDIRSEFTSLTYVFIGVTKLSGINLIVLEFGKLIEPQLTLVNSKVIVEEDVMFIVDQSDKSLIAWGNGKDGKTGTGNQGHHGLMLVHTDRKFLSVTAGKAHSLGVTRDGFLYSWGTNFVTNFGETGQLGLGDADSRMAPTKINLTSVVQASAGYGHSLVRVENGDVYSFGASLFGQLGHDNTYPNQYFPKKIESLSNVASVSAGYGHSLALLSTGEAKAWGYNEYGQLGIGSSGFSAGKSSPHHVALNFPIKKAVACFEHSFFLTESGELFATGRNHHGQLCVGDINNRNSPTPIVNSKDFHVVEVSCGKRSSIF
ncbi:hypothetical protein GEMRC1_007940 [Eukaryota sp. GEM-RC1]